MSSFNPASPGIPSASDRGTMVRWLAFLLAAGGAFTLLAIAFLPLPPSADLTGSAAAGSVALVMCGLLLGVQRYVPGWAIPLLLAGSTVVVSLGTYFWGPSPTDDAMFYVWVMFYAAYFFPGRQAALQLGWVALCYATVLVAQGAGQDASTRWAVTVTTLIVAGAAISRLVRVLRVALSEQERAAAEREALMGRLQAAALTDELTGLPNRRAWEEQFTREVNRARRSGTEVCVAVLDLDRFKSYNDSHGHRAGDRLLQEASAAWRDHLRVGDVLARYGGEEFTILLPGCAPEDATALIERLRAATPPARTVSAGLAVWDGIETPDDLIDRADNALYEAKARGRDRAIMATTPPAAAAV
jgi:diguanylate cyclase (GGDEF)-like protein